jgi:hypothetical protein
LYRPVIYTMKIPANTFNFTSKSRSTFFKMQPTTGDEQELVKQCMAELCTKAGFAGPQTLVQRDLEFLSEHIESQTGVLISLSTIRRLLNGQFSRLPQIATLNAIAQSAGYRHWQDFRLQHVADPITTLSEAIMPAAHRKFSRIRIIAGTAFLVIIILGLLAMLKRGKPQPGHTETARFAGRKTTGNELPNTVVFNYNIDNVDADSFFIQQSWDRNRRVRIYKNSYTLTDIYYEPGYHTAKLIANDQVIKTQDLSIPTDRWFFYAKEKAPAARPVYIFPANGWKNGSLQLVKDDIENSSIDLHKENQYIYTYFPSRIESSSDNFVLRYRIRVHELNPAACPYLMVEVFCQRNFMYFFNMPRGCAGELRAQFSENYLDGKTNDLSVLGLDINAWQDAELVVKNKKASIRVNGTEVFSTSYQQSGGLITGLGFISNGLCEVDFVELKTVEGKDIYSNDFE